MEMKLKAGNYMIKVRLEEEDDSLLVHFPYNRTLMEEIKCMQGARWHGYDEDNPRKLWSIKNCDRNWFQLNYLAHSGSKDPYNPYLWYEQPLKEYKPLETDWYEHQIDMIRNWMTYRYDIWAAEMGCVTGDAIINVNYDGASSKITLQKLYDNWVSGWAYHNVSVRSLCGDYIGLNPIKAVVYKGFKEVIKLTLKSGKQISLTPDHEVCVGFEEYKEARQLSLGDSVFTNGRWMDKDGYIRVGGYKHSHPRWTPGGVYEHILVMEAAIGRYVTVDEIVHHVNEVKHDNRLENLELLRGGQSEHAKLHGRSNYANFGNGNLLPHEDTLIGIEEAGLQAVYDIVCADPHRNFVANGVIVHNCGKTRSAIRAMELSLCEDPIWVGPKSALYSVQLEFMKWKSVIFPRFVTYEGLKKLLENWPSGKTAPDFVVFDECSRVRNPQAQRSIAALHLANSVRKDHGKKGSVILMSGSPAPKNPADWWHLVEIACPGFLREGTQASFKKRLAFIENRESISGGMFPSLIGWKDDEKKCKYCGQPEMHDNHLIDPDVPDSHNFEKSVNEVHRLYNRMKGVCVVKFKKDCLDLPDKVYREIVLKPSIKTINLARMIEAKCSSTIQALTLLRELSDGFQYSETITGKVSCSRCHGTKIAEEMYDSNDPDNTPGADEFEKGYRLEEDAEYPGTYHQGAKIVVATRVVACTHCDATGEQNTYKREAIQVETPKEEALLDILAEHEDVGRIVIFGGFTGSLERVQTIVKKVNWTPIVVDGKGWRADIPGSPTELLQIFQERKDLFSRVAFIGNADSCGMGLNLTASPTICYYSNSFNAESRIQSEDRCHRPGMSLTLGCNIIDLLHLPSDKLVLDNLKKKRKLQNLSMGQLKDSLINCETDE